MVAYHSQTISVIAGEGAAERPFRIREVVIERSSVLQEWKSDPDSIPPRLRRGKDIYLGWCNPDVMREVLRFLDDEHGGRIAPADDMIVGNREPLFWVQMCKLAKCLAIDSATAFATNNLSKYLSTQHCTREAFIQAVLYAGNEDEGQSLLMDEGIRNWVMAYLSRNMEAFRSPPESHQLTLDSSKDLWRMMHLLMTLAVQLRQEI